MCSKCDLLSSFNLSYNTYFTSVFYPQPSPRQCTTLRPSTTHPLSTTRRPCTQHQPSTTHRPCTTHQPCTTRPPCTTHRPSTTHRPPPLPTPASASRTQPLWPALQSTPRPTHQPIHCTTTVAERATWR